MKKIIIILSMLFVSATIFVLPCFGDVINGCYQKANGQLRIVNSASGCKSNEVLIQWNQSGLPGTPGAGGPEVYDANGQFLGVYLGRGYWGSYWDQIYLTSIKKHTEISQVTGEIATCLIAHPVPGPPQRGDFFNNSSCTPDEYPYYFPPYQICKYGGKYYTGAEGAPIQRTLYRWVGIPDPSYPEGGYWDCQPYLSDPFYTTTLVEVALPFTEPVALPMIFK